MSATLRLQKFYDSARREGMCNILIVLGAPMRVVIVFKMCLNGVYSKVRIGKYWPHISPIQNGLKQGDALSPLLSNFA
jgi:hypothetical protein